MSQILPQSPPLNRGESSTIRVEFCNIRSAANKIHLVQNHLQSNNIDFLFLTESWLTPNILTSMVCPPGYLAIRSDRVHSRGGGVLLLFKQHLKVINVVELSKDLQTNCSNDKFEVICIDLLDGLFKFRLCCFYVPPKSSQCLTATKALCAVINKISSQSQPVYIFGDFNYPKIDWSVPASYGDKAHNAFVDFCSNNVLNQCVHEPTHVGGNTLDILLSNYLSKTFLLSVSVLPPLADSCDHNVVAFNFKFENVSDTSATYRYPDFSKANYSDINLQLKSYNWENVFNSGLTLQSQYDKFLINIKSAIAQYVPTKSTKNKKFNRRPKHLRHLLKTKHILYKKSKINNSYKPNYKKASRDYDKAVSDWYNQIESNLCNNPSSKKFYNYVNNKLKVKSSIPPLSNDNKILTSDIEKANLLNSCFQNFFTKDNFKLPSIPERDTNGMAPFSITTKDVKLAVNRAKDKLSRTPEGVPTFFLKRIIDSVLSPLTHLFNTFLHYGFVPSQWKLALIVPIFKKGNRSDPQNYRPVSLTSSLCRIYEAIIFDKILNYLLSNSLLSSSQFGFLPQRSSCSQLLHCLNKWYNCFFRNEVTSVVYSDIAKAFDTVSHSKLTKVIASYKICPRVIFWLQNFLTDRFQHVIINNSLSKPLRVFSGVPQGSVIGPLLFVMFFNDITTCATSLEDKGGISLFADDAKLFSPSMESLQDSLNKLYYWTEDFQLRLAPHKCYLLQIRKPSVTCQSSAIFLNNMQLQSTDHIKDLGIIISNNLTWSKHIHSIYTKASARSYHILKSFKSKNIYTLIKLFKTYVRPLLEFNTPVWSPYLKKDIDRIESVQRHFTKRACQRCNIAFTSYDDRLLKLKMNSLQYRRISFDIIQVYKMFYGISDLNFNDFFTLRRSPYVTRGNSLKIENVHTYKSTQWLNTFFGRSVKYWNELPNHVAMSRSLFIFKAKLKDVDLSPHMKHSY